MVFVFGLRFLLTQVLNLPSPIQRINKTGLQPVSRPVEQVSLISGFGVGQSPFGAMAKQTDRQY